MYMYIIGDVHWRCVVFFCSYINERNRQRNVTRAELALKVM